uniref:Uncharacterized protein n=1 Tax=Percolomonas cosmopolitus TaxID=63605 RepID=A0A7S1KP47_9EUKA|mmetsp:Transcript_3658/g.13930  ORF Transcript_3658/g.13930 Transcript_3658/m.13930 type:complete len:247 (+) Transcript_3658:179-919(+)|eukprot:CAMPEP_0117451384 /NCGR_PEP_ID=MMETSP0759-20121206/8978_1 /TAXON_ID=63605 /ORGANISM="Percolomonas cosmopolitus, Strain WS" /LENGTH=246 /DNA_ID=CAMNT_0005243979 /DNA_START=147 /DNA_END=887 /DNA_ORIENTATION=+
MSSKAESSTFPYSAEFLPKKSSTKSRKILTNDDKVLRSEEELVSTTTKQRAKKQNDTKHSSKSPQQKSRATASQLGNALLLSGFFIASNLIEISVLKYGLQLNSDEPLTSSHEQMSAPQFVKEFYRWKSDAPILKWISYVALPLLPFLIYNYIKDGLWDVFVRTKKASLVRHACDFLTLALFAAYVVFLITSISPFEKTLAISAETVLMERMLMYQYIMMAVNVFNTIIPVVKYRDSKKMEKVKDA